MDELLDDGSFESEYDSEVYNDVSDYQHQYEVEHAYFE